MSAGKVDGKVFLKISDIREVSTETLTVFFDALSPNRRKKAEKIKNDKSRALSILASHTLEQLFEGIYTDLIYGTTSAGKPCLENGYDFSISHSGNFAAVLCASAPGLKVGIDIEDFSSKKRKEKNIRSIAEKFFSEEEKGYIFRNMPEDHEDISSNPDKNGRACPTDDCILRFLKVWTMKEAAMKALQRPLTDVLREVAYDIEKVIEVDDLNDLTLDMILKKRGTAGTCQAAENPCIISHTAKEYVVTVYIAGLEN